MEGHSSGHRRSGPGVRHDAGEHSSTQTLCAFLQVMPSTLLSATCPEGDMRGECRHPHDSAVGG